MNKSIKLILGIVSFALIVGAAYFAYYSLSKNFDGNALQTPSTLQTQKDNSDPAQTEQQMAAPDFTMTDANGNETKLSDFFGKPIVLNFWASWCPPCKAELPDFQKVYDEMKNDVTFLMVNMTDGQRETVAKGSSYIADNSYTFPVYYDVKQEAAYGYGIQSIPTTLFIDKDGYILAGWEGMISEATLREGIAVINP